jgi:hypothetical protein
MTSPERFRKKDQRSFGVRVAVELVRRGIDTAPKLAAELTERSGVPELRRVLTVGLADRSDLLEARAELVGGRGPDAATRVALPPEATDAGCTAVTG